MTRLGDLHRDRAAVSAFAEAVETLMAAAVRRGASTSLSCRCPLALEEPEVQRRWAVVHRAAQPACEPLRRTGCLLEVRLPGVTRSFVVNPAEEWETLTGPAPQFSLADLLACCYKAVGHLDEAIARGERTWRGRFGRLAPWTIRAAASVALCVAIIALGHLLGINS